MSAAKSAVESAAKSAAKSAVESAGMSSSLDTSLKRLIIIGARNLGREIYSLATQCTENGTEWEIAGFLDERKDTLEGAGYDVPVLGTAEAYKPRKEDRFVCAIGDPAYKKKYVEMIRAKGGIFTNLIHPTTIINVHVRFGVGVIVQPFCLVSNDVRIDDFVTIQANTTIGHDAHCMEYCHLSAYTFLGGFVKMGRATFTGTRATVLPKMSAGDHSKVGANSLVVRDVPPGENVFGSPAARIKSMG